MNGLLLDTCAVIWMADGSGLTATGTQRLQSALDSGEPILMSPITAWEIGVLNKKNRIRLTVDPEVWLDSFQRLWGASWAELSPKILIRSSSLPGNYGNDPADRIILATARELGLTIFTGDRAMIRYGEEGNVSIAST